MENNLEIDVKNAKALGLSYGQYKALSFDPQAVPVEKKKDVKICPVCGGIVNPPRLKICSDECARARNNRSKRQRSRDHYYSQVKDYAEEGGSDADS